MKLNKNGWGLRVAIAFILVLFTALFIVYSMISGEDGFGNTINRYETNYESLEKKVRLAGKEYQEKYYKGDFDIEQLSITLDQLYKEDMLTSIKDLETDKPCSGYVLIYEDENEIVHTPYIKCDNYQTNGYSDSNN